MWFPSSKGPVIALELFLLSMARAQSVLSRENPDALKIFDAFRRAWSDSLPNPTHELTQRGATW